MACGAGITSLVATVRAAPGDTAARGDTAASGDAAAPRDASASQLGAPSSKREDPAIPKPPDRTGRKRVGKASFYAKRFAGKKMADGTPMQPQGDNAASKTLPLGTKAKVTNLATGQSAIVTIQDRGPYVKGRIVDLSPSTAESIGINHDKGVAKVAVAPIAVPLPDGTVKPGVAAADSASH
jgi:rare lipoprotein A